MMRGCLSAALLLIYSLGNAEGSDGLYLYQISVEGAESFELDDGPLIVSLEIEDRAILADSLAQTSVKIHNEDDRGLRVTLHGNDTFIDKPDTPLTHSSWVMDFDEAPVQGLLEALWEATSDDLINPDFITQYTYDVIVDKNYMNGFNIASQVANSLEGDCTEHAVLNAALVRANGFQARVVMGLLILVRNEEVQVFGHAWNEILESDAWRVHDATRPKSDPAVQRVFYLPLTKLENEGPGYAMSVIEFALRRPTALSFN